MVPGEDCVVIFMTGFGVLGLVVFSTFSLEGFKVLGERAGMVTNGKKKE